MTEDTAKIIWLDDGSQKIEDMENDDLQPNTVVDIKSITLKFD